MPSPKVDVTKELQAAQKALAPALTRLKRAAATLDPKALPVGTAVDMLYAVRQASSSLAALIKPLREDALDVMEGVLEEHFINTLAVGESSGVQGHAARVQVSSSPQPVVKPEDWEKFFAWVAKTKQWELLQRKVNREAVRERWDAKKRVQYVSVFNAKTVSCTKLGGKAKR
jgi:hypothetical protein